MFRLIVIILVAICLISILRMIAGVVLKGFASLVNPDPDSAQVPHPRSPEVPLGGELRKDPVCGTYVSTSTSLTKQVKGEKHYFCSVECRDKFA